KEEPLQRREALTIFLKAAGGVVAATVGIPLALKSLSPLLRHTPEPRWSSLGKVDRFPIGRVLPAAITPPGGVASGVFVWRKDSEEFVVYSRACTDLGCPLTYDGGSEWFFCPCHGGIFDKEGNRRAGPPKHPMWRFSTRVRDGSLEIDLASVPPMA